MYEQRRCPFTTKDKLTSASGSFETQGALVAEARLDQVIVVDSHEADQSSAKHRELEQAFFNHGSYREAIGYM
jgi:hypothetical protein